MTSTTIATIAAVAGVGVVGLGLLWFHKYKALMLREMKAIKPRADLISKYPALGEYYKAKEAEIMSRLK